MIEQTKLKILLEGLMPYVKSGELTINENAPLAPLTTFGVGGRADVLLCPQSFDSVKEAVKLISLLDLPCFTLGHGSNVLISDKGISGVTIHLGQGFAGIKQTSATTLEVEAGAKLADVATFAAECGLTGCEGVSGIPGSLGGAVLMNAGAYEHEMSEIVQTVVGLTKTGELVSKDISEMAYGYRQSWFMKHKALVLKATLRFARGNKADIIQKMAELKQRRETTQPLEAKSAGSAFKRPTGYFAGKLISDAGLKGRWFGHAGVSAKHAGFIIQDGEATATEVFETFLAVRNAVHQNSGVWLSPEVRLVGEFGDGAEVFNEGE